MVFLKKIQLIIRVQPSFILIIKFMINNQTDKIVMLIRARHHSMELLCLMERDQYIINNTL